LGILLPAVLFSELDALTGEITLRQLALTSSTDGATTRVQE